VGKLIVSEFVTLDGVMEAPSEEPGHPHSGWVFEFMGSDQVRYKLDECLEAEALLIGRVTYDVFAESWPTRSGEFADRMNAMPKYVVSSTLQDPAWHNSVVIRGDVAERVGDLTQQSTGPILVVGSRTLVHALMVHDLVDEYRLMIFPVVIGCGRRLFPERSDKTALKLEHTETFDSGVVVHTYHPASRSPAMG
jgi:dihydrofolate reductase